MLWRRPCGGAWRPGLVAPGSRCARACRAGRPELPGRCRRQEAPFPPIRPARLRAPSGGGCDGAVTSGMPTGPAGERHGVARLRPRPPSRGSTAAPCGRVPGRHACRRQGATVASIPSTRASQILTTIVRGSSPYASRFWLVRQGSERFRSGKRSKELSLPGVQPGWQGRVPDPTSARPRAPYPGRTRAKVGKVFLLLFLQKKKTFPFYSLSRDA